MERQEKKLQARQREFITIFRDHYASYHNHKENMAYTGAAAYLLALGAGLLLGDWPPFGIAIGPYRRVGGLGMAVRQ